MRFIAGASLAVALTVLALGQAGGLHPLGDSLAVLQVPALALAALGLAWVRWPAWLRGLVLLAVVVLALLRLADWTWPGPVPEDPVTLYQKNLRFDGIDAAAFRAEIGATAPDLITLQEVSRRNAPLVADPGADYATRHHCAGGGVGGTAVLARFPAVPGSAVCLRGMAAIALEGPEGRFWLVSVHLHWPWPYGQAEHSAALLARLEGLEGPVVIGGDFNMVPWSHRLRAFARASRSDLVRPIGATLWRSWVPLPIDHVLAPCGGGRKARPELGSDHRGVLARISLGPECAGD
ncbi:MAG: endonuclease [Rhodobacteraceae bacterium]|nr:MAG: endonuclease [Paracoccaceae bacterium]